MVFVLPEIDRVKEEIFLHIDSLGSLKEDLEGAALKVLKEKSAGFGGLLAITICTKVSLIPREKTVYVGIQSSKVIEPPSGESRETYWKIYGGEANPMYLSKERSLLISSKKGPYLFSIKGSSSRLRGRVSRDFYSVILVPLFPPVTLSRIDKIEGVPYSPIVLDEDPIDLLKRLEDLLMRSRYVVRRVYRIPGGRLEYSSLLISDHCELRGAFSPSEIGEKTVVFKGAYITDHYNDSDMILEEGVQDIRVKDMLSSRTQIIQGSKATYLAIVNPHRYLTGVSIILASIRNLPPQIQSLIAIKHMRERFLPVMSEAVRMIPLYPSDFIKNTMILRRRPGYGPLRRRRRGFY